MARLRTFEDFPVGSKAELGVTRMLDRSTIEHFRETWDPALPFEPRDDHKPTTASRWHVCGALMRMICDSFLLETAGLGAPGMQDLRWHQAVHAGETLTAQYTVRDARVSARRPELGIANLVYDMRNQHDDLVFSWTCTHLMRTRLGLEAAEAERAQEPEPNSAPVKRGDADPSASHGQTDDVEHNAIERPLTVGQTTRLGTHTFERDAITAFAAEHDPQRFHLTEAGARDSLFGALCASGWHTIAAFAHLRAAHGLAVSQAYKAAGLTPPTVRFVDHVPQLRWMRPVFVDACLTYTTEIRALEPRPSNQGAQRVLRRVSAANTASETVFTLDYAEDVFLG